MARSDCTLQRVACRVSQTIELSSRARSTSIPKKLRKRRRVRRTIKTKRKRKIEIERSLCTCVSTMDSSTVKTSKDIRINEWQRQSKRQSEKNKRILYSMHTRHTIRSTGARVLTRIRPRTLAPYDALTHSVVKARLTLRTNASRR